MTKDELTATEKLKHASYSHENFLMGLNAMSREEFLRNFSGAVFFRKEYLRGLVSYTHRFTERIQIRVTIDVANVPKDHVSHYYPEDVPNVNFAQECLGEDLMRMKGDFFFESYHE